MSLQAEARKYIKQHRHSIESGASPTINIQRTGCHVQEMHTHHSPDDAMAVGPLGYQGHEAAMKCVHEADCIELVGSRMSPSAHYRSTVSTSQWPGAAQSSWCRSTWITSAWGTAWSPTKWRPTSREPGGAM